MPSKEEERLYLNPYTVYVNNLTDMVSRLIPKGIPGGSVDFLKNRLYDDVWDIRYDQQETSEELSIIAYTKQEDLYGENNVLLARLQKFHEYDVKEYTGLNFAEYLELPRSTQDMIIDACKNFTARKKSDQEEVDKNLRQLEASLV